MPGSTSLEQKTMEYLWNAANELKGIAPTISQRLASRLVTSIPEDGGEEDETETRIVSKRNHNYLRNVWGAYCGKRGS
ncbi:unnamed protein product [Agarophyton chilense]